MAFTELELKPGDAGVKDTVNRFMITYAVKYSTDSQIKKIVQQETRKYSDDISKIKALFRYIIRKMTYKSDPPDAELVMSPKHTLLGTKNYGDCDDLSVALACLLLAAGYKCAYKTVAWKPGAGDNFSHVYVVVEYENGLVPLDPTMKEIGFGNEVSKIRRAKIWKAG